MTSTWTGPPGQLIRAICFHPDTLIKLKDNSLVKIKDIQLNSELKNGAIAQSLMIINIDINNDNKQIEDI